MDIYKSEDEQVEALKKWWDDNGKSIVAGIVLGLGAIFGWRAWQDYDRQQAEAASALYQNLYDLVAENENPDEVRVISEKIMEDYGSTAYAIFARLSQAKMAIEAKDYEAAEGHLRWALENNDETSIDHLIRLRLARVLSAMEQYDEALTLLNVADKGEYGGSYNETEGDVLLSKGNVESARSSYQNAMTMKRAAGLDVSILEMKLDDIGKTSQ